MWEGIEVSASRLERVVHIYVLANAWERPGN